MTRGLDEDQAPEVESDLLARRRLLRLPLDSGLRPRRGELDRVAHLRDLGLEILVADRVMHADDVQRVHRVPALGHPRRDVASLALDVDDRARLAAERRLAHDPLHAELLLKGACPVVRPLGESLFALVDVEADVGLAALETCLEMRLETGQSLVERHDVPVVGGLLEPGLPAARGRAGEKQEEQGAGHAFPSGNNRGPGTGVPRSPRKSQAARRAQRDRSTIP